MHLIKTLMFGTLMALCSFTLAANDDLFQELDDINQAFAKAILDKDIDSIVNSYTDDACVIAPTTPRTCGKTDIRAFWVAVAASDPKDVKIEVLAVGASADLAYATGTLMITDTTDLVTKSNFVLVFKQISETWKLHLDTWTPA
jgi:ketosteroid isomerase-like protein